MNFSTNIQIVLDILTDEVRGDTASALQKMSPEYTQTWMEEGFPSETAASGTPLEEVYAIKGREYHIYSIAEAENRVMVECVEQYPNPETGKLHRTPEILVVELADGKIVRGRHYCDPRLSHADLTDDMLKEAYKGSEPIMVIK